MPGGGARGQNEVHFKHFNLFACFHEFSLYAHAHTQSRAEDLTLNACAYALSRVYTSALYTVSNQSRNEPMIYSKNTQSHTYDQASCSRGTLSYDSSHLNTV